MDWRTHEVGNVVPPLQDYSLYRSDVALVEAVQRATAADPSAASAHDAALDAYGRRLGAAGTQQLAEDANRFGPQLRSFDRVGHRIDTVDFHPAWHAMLSMARAQGMVAQPFFDARRGAWSAFAAGFSMHGQIESGSQCPVSMSFASIPVLRREPALFDGLRDKLFSTTHDPRDLPIGQKDAILIGMGLTEKQGGSDVRANTTRATAIAGEGRGAAYALVGHKWFFSAPMCDAHLVVARTESGPSCFFVPRWRPDGSRNAVRIQRLKDKLGNRSNASSEVEFHEAWGVMVGDEGRGIPTLIEMANHTRLHCVLGSAGQMRQSLVQALHHARRRHAFGRALVEHGLMQSVLADMALESEAATHLMMRLAAAFEAGDDPAADSPLERAFRRILTPAAKLWVCKRGIALAGEAMEVLGGNGYVEDGPMARLFRDMPVNSIWEGSGNVMALDVLRAASREPEAMQALLREIAHAASGEPRLRARLNRLTDAFRASPQDLEADARRLAQDLVLLVQAALLIAHAPAFVADAFIASRFDADGWGGIFGTLPGGVDRVAILDRAWPA